MRRKRVVVADDEEMMAEVVADVLGAAGFEVLVVHDGKEAFRMVREAVPDAVVLDVMMPRMDGRDVCRRIRSDRELDGLPIVLYSTMSESEVAWRDAGADAFHPKSRDVLNLPDLIRRLLEK